MEKKQLTGHLVAVLTIFIWGLTFISTKILLVDFSPVEILFIRFVIGFVGLCIIFPHRLKVKDKKEEILFIGAGSTGICLYYLLENFALTMTSASNAGVIVSVAPFFTALLSYFFLKEEKLRKNFFVGFFVSMIGIMMMSCEGKQFEFNPMGDILAFLSAMVWAVYSLFTKRISQLGYSTILITRRIFIYGILFMIPFVMMTDFDIAISKVFQIKYIFHFLFLGFGASALCFVTWNYAIKILGAVQSSVYIYLVSVITVVVSVLFLNEPINWVIGIGTMLTVVGLIISEYQKK